ncbi:MAG: polyprenyl synthetase family protein, partial [Deltaproteobacteria bacterium]|nr:polyprenyl synthetase family protein [Deltaproteobacteria bacterium]
MREGFDLDAWLRAALGRVEPVLRGRFAGGWPPAFAGALEYPLFTGGKRVRPALVLAACEAVGGALDAAVPVAVAFELVHTYSLVHDDLPCMDDDDFRRGMPTVHKRFDEATAVLVGDGLLTEAFAVLAEAPLPVEVRVAVIARLAVASGPSGMVGGQAADVAGGVSTLA